MFFRSFFIAVQLFSSSIIAFMIIGCGEIQQQAMQLDTIKSDVETEIADITIKINDIKSNIHNIRDNSEKDALEEDASLDKIKSKINDIKNNIDGINDRLDELDIVIENIIASNQNISSNTSDNIISNNEDSDNILHEDVQAVDVSDIEDVVEQMESDVEDTEETFDIVCQNMFEGHPYFTSGKKLIAGDKRVFYVDPGYNNSNIIFSVLNDNSFEIVFFDATICSYFVYDEYDNRITKTKYYNQTNGETEYIFHTTIFSTNVYLKFIKLPDFSYQLISSGRSYSDLDIVVEPGEYFTYLQFSDGSTFTLVVDENNIAAMHIYNPSENVIKRHIFTDDISGPATDEITYSMKIKLIQDQGYRITHMDPEPIIQNIINKPDTSIDEIPIITIETESTEDDTSDDTSDENNNSDDSNDNIIVRPNETYTYMQFSNGDTVKLVVDQRNQPEIHVFSSSDNEITKYRFISDENGSTSKGRLPNGRVYTMQIKTFGGRGWEIIYTYPRSIIEEIVDMTPEQPINIPDNMQNGISMNTGYYVKVTYFKPTDIRDVDSSIDFVRTAMLRVREFYKNQMNQHGYGDKTFEFEMVNDQINVNLVEAKHPTTYYYNDAQNLMFQEIDSSSFDPNIINVIVIGGVNFLERAPGGFVYGTGISNRNRHFGGQSVLPEKPFRTTLYSLTIHEIGHAFGLPHTKGDSALNPRKLTSSLLDYETRFLNKNYFFNNPSNLRNDLSLTDLYYTLRVNSINGNINQDDKIDLTINLRSSNGIYQIIVVDINFDRDNVVGYKAIEDPTQGDDITIKMNIDNLGTPDIKVILMDVEGIHVFSHRRLSL